MLSWRLQTGSEKAELQELNARLYDYVCRVRELERENLLLEEELRGRHGYEGLWAEAQARFAKEARSLRQHLDELSWAAALAEGERDALRRELRELQLLGEEARAARGRLDAELDAQRRELQEELGARAALEALLGRLQAERRGLGEAHERDVRELRARAAGLTLRYRARAAGPTAPPPRMREVYDGYALLVAESWRETVQLYEDEVRELEEALRRGQDSRREAEEETRLCAQEAEALRREALELEQLRALLEDELLRVREAYELQAEERQREIACLEDEKAALTLAMADRLRDYQELVQVKTSLSLEVATYRALLEGESNPEIQILTERIENVPQEFRNKPYQYTTSVLQRENERNLFPRQKAHSASFNHSLVPRSQTAVRSAARRDFLGSRYSSFITAQQENSYEKTASSQTNFRNFSPTPGLLRNTEAQVKTFPDRPRTEGIKGAPTSLAKESAVAQESYQERQDSVVAGAPESTWSNERTVILGKKMEAKATREQERNRPRTIQTKREEKMFDSKEKASEERNLRWEELTKLDKEARKRESQQMKEKAREESLKEKRVRESEIPISLEVSQDSTAEAAPQGLQTPLKKDAGDGARRGVETREAGLRLGTSDTAGSLKGNSMTETIAENIVSSILKQFTHSPETEASADSFPDTKVTYVDRKELPGDRKTKTEIVVESKLTEEVDISDEAGLDYLLSKEAKEVKLKGKSAEHLIGDIISLGLKGREGRAKVVNVEIIEEPVSYVSGEKADEFSTPFEVEEVDDVSSGSKGLVEEEVYKETDITCPGNEGQKTRQPQENITHFEEVTEAGDLEGEQSYLVSTPDEYPGGHERDEGPVYGQIHIEEESTIRYSWQDEIVPGSRRRMERDDALGEKVVKPLDVPEASLEGDMGSTHWKGQARSGEFHAEPIVIEKEIKIPHEFHASIKGGFKEPRHQLVEVIEQLEESLPERMKEELSTFTREGQGGPGGGSVDVKKVQTAGGGAVTLVAEVSLLQTVDADQLDLEELSRDEAGEIEKAVESVVRDGLARRHRLAPGSPDGEARTDAPAASRGFKRWATQELYRPSGEEADAGRASPRTELVTSQGPVSASVEVTSPRGFAQSHVLEDVSQSVRHVQIEPPGTWRTEQVSPEGPAAQVVEISGEGDLSWAASSAGASLSARHLTLGPDQSQLSKEVFFPGPDPPCPGAGDSEEPGPAEVSTDPDRSGRHSPFGSQQFHSKREIIFQAPASEAGKVGDYFSEEESAGTQTSVKHLQLGLREGFSEQIQLTAPLSDRMELSVREASVHTEVWSGNGTSIRHIKTVPQRHQGTEQIVPPPSEFSDSESKAYGEGSADVTQATRSYAVGRRILMTEKSTFQRAVSESSQEASSGDTSGAEATSGVSSSFRHIQLGPAETNTSAQVVFHGPISKTFALAGSVDSPEIGEVADSGRTLRHVALGHKETSFTFQMDVSNVETTPRWTREATVLFPAGTEAEAHSVSDRDAWRDASSRNDLAAGVSFQGSAGDKHQAPGEKGKEQAEFDKMVQLQRMVDQRSVISDEKKVALLYLDNQEEENEGHWF
ncbi:PREDICTED: synemin isoform X1 [Lipotes vexillifer]|uniref:Synemin isoform X1 n=1 Tax=Lipotes vexillifer TaxID=118797 RepID=A0A340YDV1_LIPVE|nr:PREDICTED: synemin isoform X1 [Lipotes vexillifer]